MITSPLDPMVHRSPKSHWSPAERDQVKASDLPIRRNNSLLIIQMFLSQNTTMPHQSLCNIKPINPAFCFLLKAVQSTNPLEAPTAAS